MILTSFWAVLSALLFSVMAALVKFCNGVFGPLELVFYRSFITMVVVAGIAFYKRETFRTSYPGLHFRRSLLGFISVAVWFFTLGELPLGTNVSLTYTTPLFFAGNFILLAFLRKEPAPWGAAGAIVLGFAGVLLLMKPTFSAHESVAALLCLSVAFIDLFGYWHIRFLGDKGEPSWRIVFYFSLFCTVCSGLGTLIFEGRFHTADAWQTAGAVAIGLLATFALLANTRAWVGGNMLLVSCLGFSAIPFSEILGILCFDNRPDALGLTGMACVTAAGIIATICTKRFKQGAPKTKPPKTLRA